MTANPLAQRRRLGAALFQLRTGAGLSHAQLAAKSGISGTVISRLENPLSDLARRPNPRSVRKVLDALGLPRDSAEFRVVERHAEIAADDGWWDARAYQRMGGQRDWAMVEAGAAEIRDYAGMLLPGLVQTAEYARHRTEVDVPEWRDIVAGRLERQRRLLESGATYRLVLEEQAVRRWPVPADVMREQLLHLLDLAEHPNISVRIVPVDAVLGNGIAPRAPYALVTYPDPEDLPAVIVDNVTQGLFVTDEDQVAGYARLHQRLCDGGLSDADSLSLIRTVADSLATI